MRAARTCWALRVPPTEMPFVAPHATYELCGTRVSLDGMQCYAVGDPASTRSLIVAPEIYGIDTGRLKCIADSFAGQGYNVVLPDLMRGKHMTAPVTDWSTFPEYVRQFPRAQLERDLDLAHAHLASMAPGLPVGMLGFCWGALPVIYEASRGRVRAGAMCHPAHGPIIRMRREDRTQLMRDVKCPLMVLTAIDDDESMKPRGSDEATLVASSTDHVFHEFEHVRHGWFTRGDLTHPANLEAYEMASAMLVNFFGRHLKPAVRAKV